MAEKTDIKSEPVLRFPEFGGKWEMVKLTDVAFIERGRFSPRPRNDPAYYGGNIPFVQTTDVVNSNGLISSYLQTLNDKGLKVSKLFEKGTILITIAANIGYTGVLQIAMACPDSLIGIRCKEVINNYFLNFYLSTQQQHMNYLAPEGAQKNINIEFLAPYPVPVSTCPEQQKIASFLSAVDKKIQQLTRKKELLEQYKKGVMQKIFSREIRFQNEKGKDYPDWEEKRLGDILTFISTNSLSRNDLTYEGGEIKNIHYGDIHTAFKMGFHAAKENVPYINRAIDLRRVTEEQFCQVGDLIIADASEDYNDIGKSIEIWNLSGEKILAGLHTFLGRDKTSQTANGFKGYLLQTNFVRMQIQKIAQGISVLGISKKNLVKVEFRLPCKAEQLKIVALLKNLDKKMESVQTQITQTKTFKKGLLQQMFV